MIITLFIDPLCRSVSVDYWNTLMHKRIFCILLDTILVILDL